MYFTRSTDVVVLPHLYPTPWVDEREEYSNDVDQPFYVIWRESVFRNYFHRPGFRYEYSRTVGVLSVRRGIETSSSTRNSSYSRYFRAFPPHR